MKAIRVHEFGGPEVLKLEDVPDLQAGAGQVVVRVKAAGVNPYDTYMRQGTYAIKPPLPYTPGSDAAGTVDSVGEGVEGFAPGDRVYVGGTLTGAYAEQTLAEAWQVHPLPPNVTFAQGAGVNVPYATAYRALWQIARAQAGETVLIHGASGGVGVAGVQLARAAGLTVIGTGGTERGTRARGRRRRAPCARPSRPGLSRRIDEAHGRTRRGCDSGDAGQRESRQGPHRAGPQWARGGDRQSRQH